MGKVKKREETPVAPSRSAPPPARRPTQIVQHRLQQACYGIAAGAFVSISAALLGEHPPSDREMMIMAAIAVFAVRWAC